MPEVRSRKYANPRRLPRRNHYQEGPGFLFVATQGRGRPPGGERPDERAAVVRRRRAALRRGADGESLATICAGRRSAAGRACSGGGHAMPRVASRRSSTGRGSAGRATCQPAIERLILHGPAVDLLEQPTDRGRVPAGAGSGRSATARSIGSSPATAATAAELPSGRLARATSGRA